jgi:hypothetical protein
MTVAILLAANLAAAAADGSARSSATIQLRAVLEDEVSVRYQPSLAESLLASPTNAPAPAPLALSWRLQAGTIFRVRSSVFADEPGPAASVTPTSFRNLLPLLPQGTEADGASRVASEAAGDLLVGTEGLLMSAPASTSPDGATLRYSIVVL